MDIRIRRYYWVIILIVLSISSMLYFFGDTVMIPYTTDSGYEQKMTSITIDNDVDLFEESTIHEIEIDMDWEDYESLIETYEQTKLKEYYKTDITIDGVTIEDVGIRLKGQLTLQETFKGSSQIESMQLPFLVKFDKYVDGQNYQGITELCIRIGNGDALLEEPLALYAHSSSGAVVPEWSYASVEVSELDPAYYVICENIDESYLIKNFDDYNGVLYKAGNFVSFTYKGDDQTEYMEDFEQKTQQNEEDYTYLIEFLKFVDESSDEEFEEQLSDWLDVDALVTMMVVNDLVENKDAFSGMNSNYYLYYNPETEKYMILAWDMNVAFGVKGTLDNLDNSGNSTTADTGEMQRTVMENMNNFSPTENMNMTAPMMEQRNMTGFSQPDGEGFPGGMQANGNEDRGGGGQMGEMGNSNDADNTLKDRFFANENFSALYEERYEEIANGIYCNDLLLEKLDLIAETFTEYNSEHNLLDHESYEAEVEDMRNYIEEKQAENC